MLQNLLIQIKVKKCDLYCNINCNNLIRKTTMDIIKIIFAIILPPVGVFLEVGISGAFWLNILLTILGYIPGIIHAVWVIAKN